MKVQVLELKPTQFAVGMVEVDERVKKIKKFTKKEAQDYLEKHEIPVVIGPEKDLHLIDHHHLARACWEAGVEKMPIKIRADLSHLNQKEFWKVLVESHWAYLHDQFGNGPHSPLQLPADIRCLADDPYRSLAWAVREEGGYEKTEVTFSEFRWADLFRKRIKMESKSKEDFKKALKEALVICKSPAAAKLPGFRKK